MFLHRLLDGHNQIITFHEEYDLYIYKILKNFFVEKKNISELSRYLNQKFNLYFNEYLTKNSQKSFEFNMPQICKKIEENIKESNIENYDLDLLFDLFYISHAEIYKNNLKDDNFYILIQTHIPFEKKDAIFFQENVNLSKVIIVIRDPVKTFDSHFYHHKFENIMNPQETLFFGLIHLLQRPILNFDNDFEKKKLFLKFEDIHNNTYDTIKNLCEKLKIEIQEILFFETRNGKKNIASFEGLKGIKNKNFRSILLPEKLNILTERQVRIIHYFFKNLIKKNHYPIRIDKTLKKYELLIELVQQSKNFNLRLFKKYFLSNISVLKKIRKYEQK